MHSPAALCRRARTIQKACGGQPPIPLPDGMSWATQASWDAERALCAMISARDAIRYLTPPRAHLSLRHHYTTCQSKKRQARAEIRNAGWFLAEAERAWERARALCGVVS